MFYSIGADVEVFAKKGNKFKSLCGLVSGEKGNPKPVEGAPNALFAVQEDNVSLEFNIPAAVSGGKFVEYIMYMKNESEKIINKHGFELSKASSAIFDESELTHPNALIFGCEPDYDAWKKIENKKPKCNNPFLRTAGGHVHVGTNIDMIEGVQKMDLMLGVPSIILDNTPESIQRRMLYGNAGAMRPKPYGFEYRVLSNFWIFHPTLIAWVYEQTKKAITGTPKISATTGKKIQSIISKGDINGAKHLVADYGIALPTLLS